VTICFGQTRNIIGTYSNVVAVPKLIVKFNSDSTFESTAHPTFFRWEDFSEKGNWTIISDTLILNPQLESKPFVESDFHEQEMKGDQEQIVELNYHTYCSLDNRRFLRGNSFSWIYSNNNS